MQSIEYRITDENGIHARPAGRIVNEAKKFEADIQISLLRTGKTANAKKLFEIMGLGVKKDDIIRIEAESEDAAEALEAIRTVLTETGL